MDDAADFKFVGTGDDVRLVVGTTRADRQNRAGTLCPHLSTVHNTDTDNGLSGPAIPRRGKQSNILSES